MNWSRAIFNAVRRGARGSARYVSKPYRSQRAKTRRRRYR